MRQLLRILTFRGEIGRLPFLLASASILLLQHLAIQLAMQRFAPDASLWAAHLSLYPLIGSSAEPGLSDLVTFTDVISSTLVAWLLGALAFARARRSNDPVWSAALAILPVVQIVVILWLALAPPPPATDVSSRTNDWACAAQGLLAGGILTLISVVVGALIFGSYGWAMFLISPLIVGAVTGFLANRDRDVGMAATSFVVVAAMGLGAAAVLSYALEGVVCLVMASPLIVAMAFVGGLIGHRIARSRRRPVQDSLAAIAMLPLAFFADRALPHVTTFELSDSVTISAPPAKVWTAITNMGAIQATPSLPFRLGLAYPTAGVIHGQGVGAIREGHFSTGVAYERVTEWQPGSRLTFDVLSDAPSLKELSPYQHVNAPHVDGYFRTLTAQFDLTPLPNGATRLTLTTRHQLDLDPAIYWVPIAEWVTRQNKARVLAHFKSLAEAAPQIAGQP